MNQYSFVKYLKKEKSNVCIIIKSGIFYHSFDYDALILNHLFNFKIVNVNDNVKRIGFPISNIEKVKNILDDNNISYMIIDNMDNIIDKIYDDNKYYDFKKIVEEKYKKDIRINNIISKIKELDNNILDKIEEML